MTLSTGTVTFLFTDIEGSTKLWDDYPEQMQSALARHDSLLRDAINSSQGQVFKTVGDAFCAVFPTAPEALSAAMAAQRAIQEETWATPRPIRVRMAVHTGTAELRDRDYHGGVLNRVARLLSIGHGGQTLISAASRELAREALPNGATLHDLGEHRLRDLQRPERVYQLLHPDLPSNFPPLRSLDNPFLPNNLPQQITSFIGREHEIGQVKALLQETHLLTLTGSGGCGKTRLLLQVAADVLDDYTDGVWLAELAPLMDPALMPQVVAQVLGAKEETGKTALQVIIGFLKGKRLLLVLDNCEHLLDACAHLADALLRSCPGVKVIASSREGLGVSGEQRYRVPSLSLPDPKRHDTDEEMIQYEAVRLFIERARLARPDFTFTKQEAPALAQLCHRLDGIPLAIELAAARVRSLSIEEISARLDNRFRLLTGGSRTALARQQTLRALIDWSYDLLSAPEKVLLHRLSVFTGGWTLEAAERVGAGEAPSGAVVEDWEVLDLLTGLVDKSLVLAEAQAGYASAGGTAARTRYRLLETVRQYARDRLLESDEAEVTRGRHRDYFLHFAEEAEAQLTGPKQASWYEWLETEYDNLRAALEWCQADPEGIEAGLRIAGALQMFWEVRGHIAEGRAVLTDMLARPGAEPRRTTARAKALNATASLAGEQGDFEGGLHYNLQSLEIYQELGDKAGEAAVLTRLGWFQPSMETARPYIEQSLALRRELGDVAGIADCLILLGSMTRTSQDPAAKASLEEALRLHRGLGNQYGIARALRFIADCAVDQGDYTTAHTLQDEAAAIYRDLGDKRREADYLQALANQAIAQGDIERTRAAYEAAAALFRELNDRRNLAFLAMLPGHILLEQGEFGKARAHYEEGLVLRRSLGEWHVVGWGMLEIGHAAWCQQDWVAARGYAREAAAVFEENGNRHLPGLLTALESLAGVAASQGKREQDQERINRGARLFGAVASLRQRLDIAVLVWWRRSQARLREALWDVLEGDAYAEAREQGQAMSLEQALAYALEEK